MSRFQVERKLPVYRYPMDSVERWRLLPVHAKPQSGDHLLVGIPRVIRYLFVNLSRHEIVADSRC